MGPFGKEAVYRVADGPYARCRRAGVDAAPGDAESNGPECLAMNQEKLPTHREAGIKSGFV